MMKKFLTLAVAMSVVIGGALPAFAEGHSEDEATETSNFGYDAESHVLLFSVDGDCTLTDEMDVTFTVEEDGTVTFEAAESVPVEGEDPPVVEEGDELFADCQMIVAEGPNGQVNHGTIVSSLVHALKELRDSGELDVPLGQALRDVAKSDLGKGDQQVKVKDDDDESSEETTSLSFDEEGSTKVKADKADRGNKSGNGKGRNK